MTRLTKALARLAHSWWQVDQVRASPTEGRLLRLRPPCYLRIGTETVEIVWRRRAEREVFYECADGSELQVLLSGLKPEVYWLRHGERQLLTESDIEVFEGGHDTDRISG